MKECVGRLGRRSRAAYQSLHLFIGSWFLRDNECHGASGIWREYFGEKKMQKCYCSARAGDTENSVGEVTELLEPRTIQERLYGKKIEVFCPRIISSAHTKIPSFEIQVLGGWGGGAEQLIKVSTSLLDPGSSEIMSVMEQVGFGENILEKKKCRNATALQDVILTFLPNSVNIIAH
ncbi:hypothetical protein HGM15179_000264 [Zosterops borbonicus]|uniref:Uncharacterized protein n=1 Tax=Zosterops borbonicus TaxID=364589 RepID=A0A8K1LUI6_9PASS|nr:hypothetical protein HGM15179_000264 [Zosterops borbonicus]